MPTDQIDAAIAAAQAADAPAAPVTVSLALSTGRGVALMIPADLTEVELLDLLAMLTTHVRAQVARARNAGTAGRILVPVR